MFPSLSRLTNSSMACLGRQVEEPSGKPTWRHALDQRRPAPGGPPEKVWLRSAGTSVSVALSGLRGRPRATRVSWTSSSACLTAASARPLRPRGAGRTPRGAIAPRLKSCWARSKSALARSQVASLLRRAATLGPQQRRPGRRPPRSPSGASSAGCGPGPGCLGPGPARPQVGLGGDHGRLLDLDLDLVGLLVELDQQVPLLHPVVVVDQDPGHLARRPGGPRRSRGR